MTAITVEKQTMHSIRLNLVLYWWQVRPPTCTSFIDTDIMSVGGMGPGKRGEIAIHCKLRRTLAFCCSEKVFY